MAKKLYDETWSFGSDKNKTGYDYSKSLMKNSLSPRFFAGNPIAEGFLGYVNDILFEAIESVKRIKTFVNYTIKQDQKDVK